VLVMKKLISAALADAAKARPNARVALVAAGKRSLFFIRSSEVWVRSMPANAAARTAANTDSGNHIPARRVGGRNAGQAGQRGAVVPQSQRSRLKGTGVGASPRPCAEREAR